jgi:DNA-binding MarR family transcriptional regulator
MPEPTPPEPSLGELKRLPPLLRRAWYSLNQAFRQRTAHLKLTPDQFSILRWLSEGDPAGLTQRQITALMASDPNTITSTITRMEKAGLVVRHPHESDRRAHRVRLQPKGKRTFVSAKRIAVELQTQILSVLREERRDSFLQDLEAIAGGCAAALEQTQPAGDEAGK